MMHTIQSKKRLFLRWLWRGHPKRFSKYNLVAFLLRPRPIVGGDASLTWKHKDENVVSYATLPNVNSWSRELTKEMKLRPAESAQQPQHILPWASGVLHTSSFRT